MSASGGATAVAHWIHYGVVVLGLVGLVALLAPGLLAARREGSRDEHELRVLALRTALADPTHPEHPDHPQPEPAHPEPATRTRSATTHDPTRVATQENWLQRAPRLTTAQRVLHPLAVVSSAAAAGVHAAVGPAHFREGILLGLFFAASTMLQLLWAGAVAVRCTRGLLVAGAVGNLAVVALWAVTRTLGLPFGLLSGPEPVGPWDVCCGVWELAVVACCVTLLRSPGPLPARLAPWRDWHPAVPWFTLGSVAVLVALSFSGASA